MKKGSISNIGGDYAKSSRATFEKNGLKTNRENHWLSGELGRLGNPTLVRQFAEENKLILNEINLEQHLELNNTFKTLDTKLISKELEGLIGQEDHKPWFHFVFR